MCELLRWSSSWVSRAWRLDSCAAPRVLMSTVLAWLTRPSVGRFDRVDEPAPGGSWDGVVIVSEDGLVEGSMDK